MLFNTFLKSIFVSEKNHLFSTFVGALAFEWLFRDAFDVRRAAFVHKNLNFAKIRKKKSKKGLLLVIKFTIISGMKERKVVVKSNSANKKPEKKG